MIVGSAPTIQATFRDMDGNLFDPATVDLLIRDPNGDTTPETPTNPSVGVYQYVLALDQAGWWGFQFTGTQGDSVVVCEGRVCAEESVFAVSA